MGFNGFQKMKHTKAKIILDIVGVLTTLQVVFELY